MRVNLLLNQIADFLNEKLQDDLYPILSNGHYKVGCTELKTQLREVLENIDKGGTNLENGVRNFINVLQHHVDEALKREEVEFYLTLDMNIYQKDVAGMIQKELDYC